MQILSNQDLISNFNGCPWYSSHILLKQIHSKGCQQKISQGYRLRFLEEEADLPWLPLQQTLMLVIRGTIFHGNLRGPLKCPQPPKKEDLIKGLLTIAFR